MYKNRLQTVYAVTVPYSTTHSLTYISASISEGAHPMHYFLGSRCDPIPAGPSFVCCRAGHRYIEKILATFYSYRPTRTP